MSSENWRHKWVSENENVVKFKDTWTLGTFMMWENSSNMRVSGIQVCQELKMLSNGRKSKSVSNGKSPFVSKNPPKSRGNMLSSYPIKELTAMKWPRKTQRTCCIVPIVTLKLGDQFCQVLLHTWAINMVLRQERQVLTISLMRQDSEKFSFLTLL